MFRRTRHRIRLGLLVVGCLLFQQVAVAAYACEVAAKPPAQPVPMEHCPEMDGGPAVAEFQALCEKHCAPDLSLLADTAALGVPALALPPVYAVVLAAPAGQLRQHGDVLDRRSDPPPRLRYCTLLI